MNLKENKKDIIKQLNEEKTIEVFLDTTDQVMINVKTFENFQKIMSNHDIKLVKLEKKDIISNPYLSNISIPRVEKNNIALGNKRIIPRDNVVKYKEIRRNMDTGKIKHTYFYCEDNLRFPAIVEGKTSICWMSVEPFEIDSFSSFIDEAKGDILLCGLGLGYASYMLSLKDDVSSITVVEINQDIIDIFNDEILPQFESKDKIKIIRQDALEYLNTNDLSKYDFINVDIYRDTVDMLPIYLPCLEIESKYKNTKFSYWLENELQEQIQMSMISSVVKYDFDYPFTRVIANDLVKENKIHSMSDIDRLTNKDNFRNTMLNWYLNHKEKREDIKNNSKYIMKKNLKI